MSVRVRPCDTSGLERLLSTSHAGLRKHHEERWELQRTGRASYLIAWEDGAPCGHVTLLYRSKYDSVRSVIGSFPEMNGLAATTPGRGIGSALIAATELAAREFAAEHIGLAVQPVNVGAMRLYERLGYREWGHGSVVDRWTERGRDGHAACERADRCTYLVKTLA